MHCSRMWFFAIAAAAMCADAAAGSNDDGKAGVKGPQDQQQQQHLQQRTADIMQAMAANGGRQLAADRAPAADCYFCADPQDQLGYLAKRAHKQYGFGLGKRLYRQYEFGLGKRSASKQYGFGLGKRAAALKQYGFGLGKRAAALKQYEFGLGRRASPQYSFGLGKRVSHPSILSVDDRESDYTYNDLSEEKKRTGADGMGHGQRFAFGLGKRGGVGAEWDDGDDGGDAALASPILWHPAVRRARLQYGFGLGKRLADDDYDSDAETMQFQDDGADNI